jgi:hypothetical protein
MVDYKIVKYCRLCRERFVVHKGEAKRLYCDRCEKRIAKEEENERQS